MLLSRVPCVPLVVTVPALRKVTTAPLPSPESVAQLLVQLVVTAR
jgi:hypothetical protein